MSHTTVYSQAQIDIVLAKLKSCNVDPTNINQSLRVLSRTVLPVHNKKVYLTDIAQRPELLEIPF